MTIPGLGCCCSGVPDSGRHSEWIRIGRTSEGNVNAFFDSYLTCATKSFSSIHSPGATSPTLFYIENDFDNTTLDPECVVRFFKQTGDPLVTELGPAGCPSLGAEFFSTPPNIWNSFYIGGQPWLSGYASWNQESHCVGASATVTAYGCSKSRIMLPTGLPAFHYNGFLARATSVYTDNGDGTRSVTDMTALIMEQEGPFAPDTWINLPQPVDFNVDVFRFLVLFETVAEWETRSGYSF